MVSSFNAHTRRATAQVSGIQELFRQSIRNNVWDAGMTVGKNMKLEAIRQAPSHKPQARHPRYYQLYRLSDPSAYSGPNGFVDRLQMHVTLACKADHFLFVHEGTTGPIRPAGRMRAGSGRGYLKANTPVMFIPAGPWGPRVVETVAGQRANPYLTRAMNYTLLKRGYL
jgi:hypothetical protein